MCVASARKLEEVTAPGVDEFVYISDKTYSKREVCCVAALLLSCRRASLAFLRHVCMAALRELNRSCPWRTTS